MVRPRTRTRPISWWGRGPSTRRWRHGRLLLLHLWGQGPWRHLHVAAADRLLLLLLWQQRWRLLLVGRGPWGWGT